MKKLIVPAIAVALLAGSAPPVEAATIPLSAARQLARNVGRAEIAQGGVDAESYSVRSCSRASRKVAYCKIAFYGGSEGYCYNILRITLSGSYIHSRLYDSSC